MATSSLAPLASLSEKAVSLCLCENLCVSVVKLLEKTLTTEAQRSYRGTEINFSDRLWRGAVMTNDFSGGLRGLRPPATFY